jgi:dethiobiotin synthase
VGESFLLTGTDTGVGKTFVGSLLLKSCIRSKVDAIAIKPVETGCAPTPDGMLMPADAMVYIALLPDGSVTLNDICFYRYREPVSPNIAARREGDLPDPDVIKEKIQGEVKRRDVVLVEGAGGIMVEILDGYSFLDLASDLDMQVIIVAPNRLGVLNQVALNVKILRESGIRIGGILLNDLSQPLETAARYNFEELKRVHGDLVLSGVSYNAGALPDDIIERLFGKKC